MRVQLVRLHLKDFIFELKMHFLSQVDKLMALAQAQKCEYVLGIFTCCFCSCCKLACAKKAEKVQFGRARKHGASLVEISRHRNRLLSRRTDMVREDDFESVGMAGVEEVRMVDEVIPRVSANRVESLRLQQRQIASPYADVGRSD